MTRKATLGDESSEEEDIYIKTFAFISKLLHLNLYIYI